MSQGVPLVALLVIGTGAYFLGRYDEKKATTPSGPVPPIPPPPPDLDALPPSYADEWEKALERYEVDVYPPESVPNVAKILPPPSVDGISVSPDCHTVAVGEDWWDLAASYVNPERPEGSSAEAILRALAPTCATRRTHGAAGLRRAIVEWVRENWTERNDGDEGRLTIG